MSRSTGLANWLPLTLVMCNHKLRPRRSSTEAVIGTRCDEAAEDILQAAFVRSIEKGGSVRDEETVIAWFYRLLRNTIIDHYRHRGSSERVLETLVHELQSHQDPDVSFKDEICGCVAGLLDTLKPEYREALDTVDLRERSLADLASQAQITANNAAVRVHRAREALRKQVTATCGVCATHGCLDCHCRSKARSEAPFAV